MKDLASYKNFIGCDVSKNTLDFAIHAKGTDYRQFIHVQVSNTKEGLAQFLKWLKTNKIRVKEAVVAMEHTGIYSEALSHWCDAKQLAFVLLHPLDVKNAYSRGRNKTDKVDSQFIADYTYTMREKLETSNVESPIINRLRQLYNERRLAVRTRTSYLNQIKTVTAPDAIRRMEKTITHLTNEIKLIEMELTKLIDEDKKIKNNFRLLLSIPGIGLINAVLTIISTGNFTRFQTSRQYAKFCCVSPLSRQSGTSVNGGEHVSCAGHSEIKGILTDAARSAIQHNWQLRAYYERKRAQGKSHGCVMNAVKFKLICRMFAVIGRQTEYAETEAFRS